MFRVMRFICIIALILFKICVVELTPGDERLQKSDGGHLRQNTSSGPMTREISKGRYYGETVVSEISRAISAVEEGSSTFGMLKTLKAGINSLATSSDCCSKIENKDCNKNCSMLTPQCNLVCGYLLLPPNNSTSGNSLQTQLTAETGGRIHLAVKVTDLRPGDNITVSNNPDGKPLESITCDSFSKEEQGKYFVSTGETFFVNYEYQPSTKGKGCGGYEGPSEKLKFETIKNVKCSKVISEDGNGNLLGDIVSPGYQSGPYPSLRDCSWTIQAPSPGFGIELQVKALDLDAAYGDYIRINAGSPSSKSHGYLMTWSNTNPQPVFKIFSGGSASIHFHSGLHMTPNNNKGFHILYKHFGNGSVPSSTTTSGPELPTPPQGYNANYIIYIAGKTPEEFYNDQDSFKNSLVGIANIFCQEEHIKLTDPISFQDVIIHSIIHCPPTWPYSQRCAEVIIQIVARTVTGEYQLTDSNLQKMWDRHGWDRNVTRSGIAPYKRNPEVFTWWLAGIMSILIIFIIILLAAWYLKTNPHNSSPKNKKRKPTSVEEKTTEANKFEYPNPPFRTIEEEDEDDVISYNSDHRDSYIDYEASLGSTTYSNNNDSSNYMGKFNPAYIHDDEEELDEISLGADDFKFQFIASQQNNRPGTNHHTSAQDKIFKLQMNADGDKSETAL